MRSTMLPAAAIGRVLPLSFIALLLLPNLSSGSTWLALSEGKIANVKFDGESVRPRGNYVQAWLLYGYSAAQPITSFNPKTFRSVKSLEVYDCATKRSSTLQTVRYADPNGQGDVVDSSAVDFEAARFFDVIPETIGANNLEGICSLYRQFQRSATSNQSALPLAKRALESGCVDEPVFVAGEMFRCVTWPGGSSYFNLPGQGQPIPRKK